LPPALGPGGTAATITVSEATVNEAAVEPKVTAVAFVKPEPIMIAVFPPVAEPLVGLIVLTTGAGTL
jgi:hypothetical protein